MQTAHYKGSIEKRLTKMILSVTSLVFFIAYSIFITLYVKHEDERTEALTKTIGVVVSQDLAKLIFLNDVSVAADVTTKLQSFAMLESAIVYNDKGKPIYQYSRDGKSFTPSSICTNKESQIDGKTLIVNQTIHYSGREFGCIKMRLDHSTLFDIFKRYALEFGIFYLFVVALSFLFASFYAKKFTNPIVKLITFLEGVDLDSSLDRTIEVTEDNEFGKLYEETNLMLAGLKKSLQEKENAEDEVSYLREYDSLTGLPNKNLCIDLLQEQIDFKTRKEWHVLFCVDIDKFKVMSDTYGQEFSDAILKAFAITLERAFDDATTIAKVGIDEFVISCRNIADDEQDAMQKIEEMINRFNTIISKPFEFDAKEVYIFVHVGINSYTKGVSSASDILKHADSALQNAKKGELLFAFYSKDIEKKAQESLEIYNELLVALKENQFELYYQLQNRADGSYIGAEALIRWNHPKDGLLSPFKFIPIVESTNLIIDVGTWVLESACKQLALWQENPKTKEWVLAVNVSVKQFAQDDFIEIVKRSIQKYNIPPNKLKIEVLESLLSNDFQSMVEKLHKIRDLGVQISIDDFGTGYSSLQYLKYLPVNQIKIDQSFVFGMLEHKADRIIAQSIINLGEAFGFDVIAEGVETQEIATKLQEYGCHYFQGYYFAKPEPIGKIEQVVAEI